MNHRRLPDHAEWAHISILGGRYGVHAPAFVYSVAGMGFRIGLWSGDRCVCRGRRKSTRGVGTEGLPRLLTSGAGDICMIGISVALQ